MNDKTDKYMQRANESLAFLRQKVDAVFATAPNLLDISSLGELPEAKAESVEEQLWDVFGYGEYYVEKVMSDLDESLVSVKNKGLFDFHKKEYKPLVEKIRELLPDVSYARAREDIEIEIAFKKGGYEEKNFPDILAAFFRSEIDDHMDTYESFMSGDVRGYLSVAGFAVDEIGDARGHEKVNAKIVFGKIWDAALHHFKDRLLKDLEGTYFSNLDSGVQETWLNMGLAFSIYKEITIKPYFTPDEWVANQKDLSPIIVPRDLKEIPRHIRSRVNEIYLSFTYGNWMSVIAMSRCLLEYAIVDETSLLKIENLYDEKRQLRPLVDLIADVKEPHTELVPSMTHIRKAGNSVMHPPRPRGHPLADLLLLPPNKHAAQKCVEGIVKIITVLYGVQPWPQKPHYRPR